MSRERHPGVELVELMPIPGGRFQMGEGAEVHSVCLAPFQIGRFPVTAGQYRRFVAASGHTPPASWPNGRPHPLLTDHPVVDVTWFDALTFCRWLAAAENRACRLPSEAEWEWAARGPEGRVYPWGNTFYDENCHTWSAGAGATSPVDAFPQGESPFGVMDMAGNVWEWCSTKFRDYPYRSADGREDLSDPAAWRTLRGGSWYDTEWGVRAARRLGSSPSRASQNTGFRVACAV